MNRRNFFGLATAIAFAPKELIVPSRTIFLPPRGGWPSSIWSYDGYNHVSYAIGYIITEEEIEDLYDEAVYSMIKESLKVYVPRQLSA